MVVIITAWLIIVANNWETDGKFRDRIQSIVTAMMLNVH